MNRNSLVIYLVYIIFGFLPSFIWLLFYLRKDRHPEPNSLVLKVFIWGMIIGPIAAGLELAARWLLHPSPFKDFTLSLTTKSGTYFFISIVVFAPIIEEVLKYLVVRWRILKDPEFDEPLDAMLYMIVSGLGFAAVENLLLVFQTPALGLTQVIYLSAVRFLSATFVHALASGTIGFWLARSIKEPDKKYRLQATGFCLAIFFHSSYNYLIWMTSKNYGLTAFIPISATFVIIFLMAISVSYNFSVLKRIHSICRVCRPQIDHDF